MEKLSESELTTELRKLNGWELRDGMLQREFRFRDFIQAMRFVSQVAEAAEAAGHHPDIDIRYNRVRLGLVTHDARGITAKDTGLAEQVSKLAST